MIVRIGMVGGQAIQVDGARVVKFHAATARHAGAQPVGARVEERRDAQRGDFLEE